MLAGKPHNKDILYVGDGGKGVPENFIYQRSVIYEHEREICFYCLECLNKLSLKPNFS